MNSGYGFHIKIDDTTYLFPTAERAPPEGYFGHGYEAYISIFFFTEHIIYILLDGLTQTQHTADMLFPCVLASKFLKPRPDPFQAQALSMSV
jgi:hypothetical protein